MLYRIRPKDTTDAGTPTISGQFLAKNKRGKKARAKLAVDIVNGSLKVDRLTVSQAAHLCRVSRSYVDVIRRPSETLGQHFERSTADERRELARTVGVDRIWDTLIHPLI